jgi:phosphoribosylamine-glycine ligase
MLFDLSGYGQKADEARKAGLLVVGGDSTCDRMEKDRVFGFRVAEEMGALVPHYEEFSSISDAISYVQTLGDMGTYFKTDRFIDYNTTYGASNSEEMVEFLQALRENSGDRIHNIIQDKIEGVAISTARWFNGKEFVGPFEGCIEHKALLNDDVGPKTGCAVNAVWFYKDESSFISEALNWHNLAEVLRKRNAPSNIYDANAVVTPDGDAFFLEWCARLGYDSEPTGQLLMDSFSDFLWCIASGQGKLCKLSGAMAYSTRIWVPPYPAEYDSKVIDEDKSVIGKPLFGVNSLWGRPFVGYGVQYRNGNYELAASSGEVGLAADTGTRLSKMNENCVEYAKSLRPSGFCFRTDGDKVIKKDAEELMKVVSDLPKGLTL